MNNRQDQLHADEAANKVA